MTLRRVLAVSLAAIMLTLGVPVTGVAQASMKTANLRGQVVDAGGRGASGLRVELVSDGLVLSSTISTTDGHFNFPGVPAGAYVVRTMANGQPAGVRVSVGSTDATALIVMPSLAKAAPQVGIAAGLATNMVITVGTTAIAVTVTTVAGITYVEAQKEEDATILVQNVAAVQQLLTTLANQIAGNTGGGGTVTGGGTVQNPFVFIPSTPPPGSNPTFDQVVVRISGSGA